jgi:DNA-binding response OmpR family regulator
MTEGNKIHKILVVDDDLGLIKLLGAVLKTKGYDVLTASEAPRGLEMAMKQAPDLIVLDVMMPIINGYNICRLLKSQEKHKHIPIVLLTSRSTEDDRKIGKEVGADAYMAKPLNTEEFLVKVRELLAG